MFDACLFFFNATATTEIYTLSLHDALPIWVGIITGDVVIQPEAEIVIMTTEIFRNILHQEKERLYRFSQDRKSTRLNSSHVRISYAVFCLKKKKKKNLELHANHI